MRVVTSTTHERTHRVDLSEKEWHEMILANVLVHLDLDTAPLSSLTTKISIEEDKDSLGYVRARNLCVTVTHNLKADPPCEPSSPAV